jgi:outer membrane protein TolC
LQRIALQRQQARQAADALLAQPLQMADAQRLMLLQSPALQALLADAWADDQEHSAARQAPLPQLGWERLRSGDATEITRSLSVGLADLLLWPARAQRAAQRSQAGRTTLARQVLGQAQAVRAQWVRAVAARQLGQYHAQVLSAAQAGADLAQRMQAAGSASRLRAAREQAQQLDAAARLAQAQGSARSETEALVRLLGLDAAQAARLQLPDRLPELPAQLRADADPDLPPGQPTQPAAGLRLDQAAAALAVASSQADSAWLNGLLDVQAKASQSRAAGQRGHGLELSATLPLADGGNALRAQTSARQLAALQRLQQVDIDRASLLRERGAAARAAYAQARQARDAVLPLRQTVLDETLLRYNGMLLSVFDLLAEARAQTGAVINAIEAQRAHWLADAALQAALDGVPLAADAPPDAPRGEAAATAAH